jgi:hypothetical protein
LPFLIRRKTIFRADVKEELRHRLSSRSYHAPEQPGVPSKAGEPKLSLYM